MVCLFVEEDGVMLDVVELFKLVGAGVMLMLPMANPLTSMTVRTVGRESRWDGERRTLNAASSW